MRNKNDSRFEREITKKSTVFSITINTALNTACRLKRNLQATFTPSPKPCRSVTGKKHPQLHEVLNSSSKVLLKTKEEAE